MKLIIKLSAILLLFSISCTNTNSQNKKNQIKDTIKSEIQETKKEIIVGAERLDEYFALLSGKRVALVANQSSKIGKLHLLDVLLEKKINIKKIFALEHGFRGNADRGTHVNNEIDEKTALPIVGIYGNNKKPSAKSLANVDIVIFDIQDAGARFFTYISSMHYVMEACAENNKKLIILDRPNPLGDYIDGPVMQEGFQSFVGFHKIPVIHGLTVGELAQMINGEKWLKNGKQCDLTVIKVANYEHNMKYVLPIKPSPNLPNYLSLRLYPSLCFFEATRISIGRGTEFPFQVIGYPDKVFGEFSFVPKDIKGMQINPIQENKTCFGIDLREENSEVKFTLKYLIDFYKKANFKDVFFSREHFFNNLAGNNKLIKQIKEGLSEEEIRKTWQSDLEKYKEMRKKYLLYK